ncbi:hypothetical protein MTP09_02940 [Chryseobacterium suipulveris]|uniref:Uncharacterized protein n=1 Tax=Chryseobacterium suipulveris TaxID=2929800 RepID=A0ABY4BS59_9FLAO|nr:hypothetical protein [Chryseobacterium suipulveris]UOE41609.1 hypothetical protein MTP09_02940 [Chryseobacterium suipulveris]
MKKLNLLFTVVILLVANQLLFSQAVDKLYLSLSATGRVYDITGVPAALPAPLATPNYSGGTRERISNLAVGYDTPGSNPTGLVFIHSNTAVGSTIYKNTVSTGQTTPAGTALIGGISTNNVPKTDGNPSGVTYGFSNSTKNLYQIYPTSANLGTVTGDAAWNGTGGNTSTIWATDTFFDYQNFIYVILQNTTNGTTFTRYLYRIDPATLTATRVSTIGGPVGAYNASATTSNNTTVGNVRGLAYLNGLVYAVSVNNNTQLNFYSINISTGASTYLRTYTGLAGLNASNQDLASVPYYIPFIFNCGGANIQETTPFVAGVSSTKTLRVPISTVYGPGTYRINVSGPDFATSFTDVTITSTTTFVDIPVTYNGTGSSGNKTLTYNINGSTTACSVNVVVEKDTDKDTIPDYQDLDSDNDGILDAVEMYCDQTIAPNGTFPVSNGPATTPAYSNQLLFFDWNGVTLSNASPTATKSVVYNGVTYTATISNYTSVGTGTPNAMVGNDILTWSGPSQMVGRYYNVNSTTFKEALYIPSTGFTGVNSFNISVTASKDGVAYPVDFVFFDAETTNKSAIQTEQIKFTNNTAGTIELLEKTGTGTIGATTDGVVNITGIGTNTVTLNETETSNVNALLFVKGYSPSVKVDITTSLGSQQGVGFAVRLNCDTDNDGTPNYLDTDSDGDGCPDAIEGGDNITQTMLNGSNAIGSNISGTLNSPAIATVDANGVPVITNTGSTFNVDGQAQGQTAGSSANASVNGCYCYKPAQTSGTILDTNHGITALGRAGADNSNWPMVRKGAWTALEAKTKGFVVNRLTDAQITAIPSADLREGMMVYNITQDCLQINIDGTSTGWRCFNTQTCPD